MTNWMNSARRLAEAENALALVKNESDLEAWHERWMTGADYADMESEDRDILDLLFRKKAAWFFGVGAG